MKTVLGFGEPAGQSSFDDATDTEQQFIFDEIGLMLEDLTFAERVENVIDDTVWFALKSSLERFQALSRLLSSVLLAKMPSGVSSLRLCKTWASSVYP